jgi:SEC-C motif domain protein
MLLDPSCPCGSQKPYATCCGPYVTGQVPAPTAESLMRSRYTAYSKGQIDYLIATWHPKAGKACDRATLQQSSQSTRWVGLTILKTQKGRTQDKRGVVEFVALYQTITISPLQLNQTAATQNPVYQLHERSRFVQEKGQWLYVDGDALPPINLKTLKLPT